MEEQNQNTMMTRGFKPLNEDAKLPERLTSKSAGYDLYSSENILVIPGKVFPIGIGVTAFMQDDEELQIRSRSGLASKQGVVVINSPGTIDADYYPMEIKVLIYNTSTKTYMINVGDRIAQGVFSKYLITDDDNATGIRDGGLGHTGK